MGCCILLKENLKTEITLLAAKFEAQKARQDSEHQAELERQVLQNYELGCPSLELS